MAKSENILAITSLQIKKGKRNCPKERIDWENFFNIVCFSLKSMHLYTVESSNH